MEKEVAAASTSTTKKKHEDKHRRKDPRSWENVCKAGAEFDDEKKLELIAEKYNEIYSELRRSTFAFQTLTKQCTVLQKEKDHNQSELAKNVVGRARLESLCRELQKQNKQIKEENMAKIKEEEEHRKEVSMKLADKLTDINHMMDENKEKSDKLREDNMQMASKLSELYKQFQKREEDISKMSHQMQLEREYAKATVAKVELELKAEKEIWAQEQALLRANLEKSEANCKILLNTVKSLEEQNQVYKAKYDDFEAAMSKSNKVFDSFKFELTTMSKQISGLEKEANSWKAKFQDSVRTCLELTETNRNQELLIHSSDKKIEQLQKLCRQLQTDRGTFLKLLKANGIEPLSEKPNEEVLNKNPKMSKKEKELELLKDNLKAVQEELNKLSTEDGGESGAKTEETNVTPCELAKSNGAEEDTSQENESQ